MSEGAGGSAPRQSSVGAGVADALTALARYREASIALVALLLVTYFQARNPAFLTTAELSVVLRDAGEIALIAVGETLLMITGEIDLSAGSTFALAAVVMNMIAQSGRSLWLGALVGLLIGVGIGLVNGVITVRFRVPSLIATLGTLFFVSGVAVTLAHSQPIATPIQQPFNVIFGENRYSPTTPFWSLQTVTAFTPFLWALSAALATAGMLRWTTFGLHTVATGSNMTAAREIGVRVERTKIANFMIAGGLAALIGIINAVQYTSADPIAGGSALTLQAIAAAVVGGTSLFGGSGTTIGSLLGAFVVATLNNGLVLIGAQATQSDIYLGAGIVAAMILNVWAGTVRGRTR
jgi:simple sugar transport system permease protein